MVRERRALRRAPSSQMRACVDATFYRIEPDRDLVRRSGVIEHSVVGVAARRWSAFTEHSYRILIGSHSIAQLVSFAISPSADVDAASSILPLPRSPRRPSSYDYEQKSTARIIPLDSRRV